ncbi:MAG TPA: hypothetical protein VFE86_17885 [Ilumatobacteraceae bacterium]|nr:hypothetical protein [Ilumatobacteraceae bacterium]
MADLERVAVRVSDGLRLTLSKINKLALGIAAITALVGIATFLTGLWVFDGSFGWIVIGGAICFAPTVAALMAWRLVHSTFNLAPQLVDNVSKVLQERSTPANALINYDTGEPLTTTARSFSRLNVDLKSRSKELPALYFGVRAICSVPTLVVIALLGTLGVGFLGTVLFITGLVD